MSTSGTNTRIRSNLNIWKGSSDGLEDGGADGTRMEFGIQLPMTSHAISSRNRHVESLPSEEQNEEWPSQPGLSAGTNFVLNIRGKD